MIKKTLLLFQLFLAVCAFYALIQYSGHLRFLVALVFLVGMFVVAKVEASLKEATNHQNSLRSRRRKKDTTQIVDKQLDCLLKSNNVLLLTDAIHYLMEDLGLVVSGVPDHRSIDRLIRIQGLGVTLGVKVVGDVAELNENWDKWEELSSFDLGKGGKRRLLIIGSNWAQEGEDDGRKYRSFSQNTQQFLSTSQLVAMTTLTLCKIYLSCKKKGLDIKTILHSIQHHPGGVFQLERHAD